MWNETCFVVQEKFPESLVICAAIGFNFKTGCQFCSNNVDSSEYRRFLIQSETIETTNHRVGKYKWTFIEDGARLHTAAATTWLLRSQCLVLPDWPPNNQDLNAIEMTWSIIKEKVKREHLSSIEELKHVVDHYWCNLDQEVLHKLVMSFPSGLRMLVATQGCSTSQYFSSHFQRISAADVAPHANFRLFSAEEDEFITACVNRLSNTWICINQLVSERFSARDRLVVKHRANWLILDAENAFLQTRVQLPSSEEILALEDRQQAKQELHMPFDPQEFSGAPFEFTFE
jgi:hypothetical protein